MNLEENTKRRPPLKFKFTNLPDTHIRSHNKPKTKRQNREPWARSLKQMYQAQPSKDQRLHDTTQQPTPDTGNIIPIEQRSNNDR